MNPKKELTEIRNNFYDSLPTGDIVSAYDIICEVKEHLKKLDVFINKLPQTDNISSLFESYHQDLKGFQEMSFLTPDAKMGLGIAIEQLGRYMRNDLEAREVSTDNPNNIDNE